MLAFENGNHLAADQDPRKPGEEVGDLVRDVLRGPSASSLGTMTCAAPSVPVSLEQTLRGVLGTRIDVVCEVYGDGRRRGD